MISWTTRLSFLLLLLSSLSQAGSTQIAVSLSPAGSFVARSSSVQGQAEKIGNNAFSAKNVVLDISTLKTGIDLRDRHMRDKYFEVKKYPRAVLHSGKAQNGSFEGDLEVHGKRKKVSGSYVTEGSTITGKFKCALSDFEIPEANYMGVGVEDEVEVEVQLPISSSTVPVPGRATSPKKTGR